MLKHRILIPLGNALNNLFNNLLIPFVIIHIRIIQYRYKKISINNTSNHTTPNTGNLFLLKAKEDYYYEQFDSWGRFHPKFSYSCDQHEKHHKFLDWLFPEKDFKEWDSVIYHKSDAITYYHNKIYSLKNQSDSNYANEILMHLKEWINKRRS